MKLPIILFFLYVLTALDVHAKATEVTVRLPSFSKIEQFLQQRTPEKTKEVKNGHYSIYYSNGNIREEQSFVDSKPDGRWTTYYENGNVEKIVNYKDARYHGVYQTYYKDGQLQEELYYENSEPNGPYKRYFENGQLKEEGTYKHGALDGLIKWYYSNGKLLKEAIYQNDKYHGPGKTYYKNGALESEWNADGYFNSNSSLNWGTGHINNGWYKHYYENGFLDYSGQYTNGKRDGEWYEWLGFVCDKTYYENGKVIRSDIGGDCK